MEETLVLVGAVLAGTAARWQTLAATIPLELLERARSPISGRRWIACAI